MPDEMKCRYCLGPTGQIDPQCKSAEEQAFRPKLSMSALLPNQCGEADASSRGNRYRVHRLDRCLLQNRPASPA